MFALYLRKVYTTTYGKNILKPTATLESSVLWNPPLREEKTTELEYHSFQIILTGIALTIDVLFSRMQNWFAI